MNTVIVVLLITTLSNLVFGLAKLIAKSKCSSCSFCGCHIKRDVELEEKSDEFNALHPAEQEKL